MWWERQIPGQFLSFLQALILPGMSWTQLPFSQQVVPGESQPPTTALISSCLWARPRENWKGLLGDAVMSISCTKLAQQTSQWAYADGK